MTDSVMEFIEAWVRDHINITRYRASVGSARAEELAKWLRMDASARGIPDTAIDSAIAGLIGAGHGLVNYISDAMASVTNSPMINPEAARLADEDV